MSPEKLLAPTVGDALLAGGKGKVFSLSIKDRTAVLMGGQKPTGRLLLRQPQRRVLHLGLLPRHPAPVGRGVQRGEAGGPVVRARSGTGCGRTSTTTAWPGRTTAPGEARGFFGQGRIFPHPMEGREPGRNAAVLHHPRNVAVRQRAAAGPGREGRGGGEPRPRRRGRTCCASASPRTTSSATSGGRTRRRCSTPPSGRTVIVRDLLGCLDEQVGQDRYTLVLTADHGVCPTPESKATTSVYHSSEGPPRRHQRAAGGAGPRVGRDVRQRGPADAVVRGGRVAVVLPQREGAQGPRPPEGRGRRLRRPSGWATAAT